MRRKYYTIKPARNGKYKEPKRVIYLSCIIIDKCIYSHAIIDNEIIALPGSIELSEMLANEPDNTWIVTYNTSWAVVLAEHISKFKKISGTGRDMSIIHISSDSGDSDIIDMRQFTLDSLSNAARKCGISLPSLPDNATPEEARLYSEKRVISIMLLWKFYTDTYIKYYHTYPSKSTGASALKALKRFIDTPIKPRGRKIRKISSQSIRPGGIHWKPGEYNQAYMYDINAAYIHAQHVINYPEHVITFANETPMYSQWIASCIINFETDQSFSPISVYANDETLHPTKINHHRTTLTYIDAALLSSIGKFEIVKFIEGTTWANTDAAPIFREWAEIIGEMSVQEKYITKVTSRSLHSKFAQTINGIEIDIIPVTAQEAQKLARQGKVLEFIPLDNGDLAIKLERKVKSNFKPFLRPDWEALTQAAARLMLYPMIDNDTIYADTDCIISTRPRPDLSVGALIGQWKLDAQGECIIIGPRCYAVGDKVRASGIMPVDYRNTKEALYEAWKNGGSETEAIETASLFGREYDIIRKHTIRVIPYPYVEVIGNQAFITRSPTKQYPIKQCRRILSNGGLYR
jgi:hypothetical protein